MGGTGRRRADGDDARRPGLDTPITPMTAALHGIENTVNFDNDKLVLIGWSGQKSGTHSVPQETTPSIIPQFILTF